jgi:cellulose synthase (UDP-forming)
MISQVGVNDRAKVIARIASRLESIVIAIAFIALLFLLQCDLDMTAQFWLSISLLVASLALWMWKDNQFVSVALLILSASASLRYISWRLVHTLIFDNFFDGFFCLLLVLSELYVVTILFLNYFQILWLDRSYDNAVPDPSYKPSVDIFIPTYNESPDILRRTVCGAQGIRYLNKQVYLLDDGRRQEVKQLADELGCGYITRTDNKHAKAGNINHALTKTKGEFVIIFDADHVPVPSFIERTIPFFKNDPKLALVQTPHRFLNASPTERNLYLEGKLPQEQELFYQRVQIGNNRWNAAFFCGSAAVLRRSALLEVGGVATETVTEDCHTCMKMHALGYNSIYVSTPLSVGLSPESFDGYVVQRSRWGRGMAQILRVDNPLVKKGLSLPQRICYFSSMMHFFFGVPRMVFLFAPVLYLLFNINQLKGVPEDVIVMLIPHLVIANMACNYRHGNIRHSYWSEVYEATLAPYLGYATTMALLDPKAGKFNVTPKGILIEKASFNEAGWPVLICFFLCLIGLVYSPIRFVLSHQVMEHQAIAVNGLWAFYNLVIAANACWICVERPYASSTHRIVRDFPIRLAIEPHKKQLEGITVELNEYGAVLKMPASAADLLVGTSAVLSFRQSSRVALPLKVNATVSHVEPDGKDSTIVTVDFVNVAPDKAASLVQLIYCNQETWGRFREPDDSLLKSYLSLVGSPFRVAYKTWLSLRKRRAS